MIQKGIVREKNGEYATVEVMRSSACVGCSKREGCISCRKTEKAKAYDPIGACVGDRVTLETNSSTVLLYALLVFVLPIVLCGVAFFLCGLVLDNIGVQILVSACIFILTYVIIYFVFDKNPKAQKSVVIKEIEKGE